MTSVDARFKLKKPVLGIHNQLLGYAGGCRIDVVTGHMTHVILATQWQSIDIKWDQLDFDDENGAFRLRPGTETAS